MLRYGLPNVTLEAFRSFQAEIINYVSIAKSVHTRLFCCGYFLFGEKIYVAFSQVAGKTIHQSHQPRSSIHLRHHCCNGARRARPDHCGPEDTA